MGIRLKLGLISTIKHQLTYAPPWHCTRARPTTTDCHPALSIRRLPVVRDAETGTSSPDSAGKDGRYSSSGLWPVTFAPLCPPLGASHLLATPDGSRILHMCPGESTRVPHHPSNSSRLDAGLPQHQITFLQDALTSLPACLFGTASPNDAFPHEPHSRAALAHRHARLVSYTDWL